MTKVSTENTSPNVAYLPTTNDSLAAITKKVDGLVKSQLKPPEELIKLQGILAEVQNNPDDFNLEGETFQRFLATISYQLGIR